MALIVLLIGNTGSALAHDVSEVARERMQNGGILDYIWTGAEHMLTGYDHLLFLLGVMFFLTRFIDILKFVTAFTIGHTITLVFATYAGISADHYLIDAVIAVTVMYKGFENLDGFRRWIGTAAPSLIVMVFIFGLIHGFGLSARLQDLTMAQESGLLTRILFFNLGVELGQIAALVVMGVVIRAWQQTTVWEPITRVVNTGLVFFGFLLLLFQLHGYLHESGHVHGPATEATAAGVPHSHDGGEPHVH
ncbi:MAG: hypothetical protein A3H44_09405 [Gammaproteobacteria bacterium RIFCSPLOWO2_02_FULL_57_10]|nr:MAG: hypothetical protein A3H44_09405 [Gammaproteobacteria bacterium RIFCSPLOWO2_02_FULL_57_10]